MLTTAARLLQAGDRRALARVPPFHVLPPGYRRGNLPGAGPPGLALLPPLTLTPVRSPGCLRRLAGGALPSPSSPPVRVELPLNPSKTLRLVEEARPLALAWRFFIPPSSGPPKPSPEPRG